MTDLLSYAASGRRFMAGCYGKSCSLSLLQDLP
jgi:hypothetical protein